jgi:putative addiction module killer protein
LISGSTTSAIERPKHWLKSELIAWRTATLVTANLLEMAFSELRIHHGAGYRIYFKRSGLEIVVLLIGGDKSSQPKDIKMAISLAKELEL